MVKKIMIAGYGSTGAYVLDFLARTKGIEDFEIIVTTRSIEEAQKRINMTLISAQLMGFYPKIHLINIDLNNIEATAELLNEVKPDIIAYTGRFIKGIKYGEYSYPNEIGYGAWLPLAIPLIYKLMEAVRISNIKTKVINSSFPDGVCPALKSIGLEPFTGAGNLNHLIPRIKMGLSNKLNIEQKYIDVKMIGSHFLNTYVSKEASAKGSKYILECTVKGENIQEISDEEIFKLSNISTVSGPTRNLMISSDIVKIIQSIMFNEGFFMHLPGPNGLIGGYPAKIFEDRIELVLPKGIDIEQAIEINSESLSHDGIEKIENGKVFFTDDVITKMKKVFSLSYPKSINVEECESFAYEIKKGLENYKK
ncbi:hypothetical protein K144313037_15120 [Clostridium tetani]|uniref:hypothetical protein n=1 Tax=Clostridium tetani TaxID=1513 RepID=UPI000D21449D|nr:hypothetical protein [Clostridium tetani]AVP54235.1 hypothetical protein C3B72_03520 [Clostridium tetani]RXI45902.1 hypothetical protein DP126_06840 [Clostridium tetani]RXI76240.1 hypothetical protein DP128_06870 [Clostridium tetani]RXM61294.1 hypothetical protein DP138_03675 [Clostridium tetani]RXM70119.1 hypothetical protein DP145_00760 [Clostridium tetani]